MSGEKLTGCAHCASLRKTCCQLYEILVTEGDKARITEFTGAADFWEFKYPSNPEYLSQDDDANWLNWAFRPDGTRPILLRKENGDCRFLSAAGCTLPMEVRPLVCRLYPYTYTERGIDGVSDACPREVIPPGRTILQVLDVQYADAVRWHWMIYTELRTKERSHADRTDIRSAG